MLTRGSQESTRFIRSHERATGIKPATIIALTALSSPEAKQEAYSSGMDLFLTKPVRLKNLDEIFADLRENGKLNLESA